MKHTNQKAFLSRHEKNNPKLRKQLPADLICSHPLIHLNMVRSELVGHLEPMACNALQMSNVAGSFGTCITNAVSRSRFAHPILLYIAPLRGDHLAYLRGNATRLSDMTLQLPRSSAEPIYKSSMTSNVASDFPFSTLSSRRQGIAGPTVVVYLLWPHLEIWYNLRQVG